MDALRVTASEASSQAAISMTCAAIGLARIRVYPGMVKESHAWLAVVRAPSRPVRNAGYNSCWSRIAINAAISPQDQLRERRNQNSTTSQFGIQQSQATMPNAVLNGMPLSCMAGSSMRKVTAANVNA
jgi:hypothetical protein